ncbi:transposase domain-containing protein [Rodentibacter myodis]|uniref:Transposase IS4 N-terminal domain-containing protein n=1 Tax=Rodentibacter myodis TaxID=1907939 RepID=A0A1V3JSW7_9PAST|nr:transposase domain-containing protein [Rodentibacter myodis]OOF59529.1 hypothetical protein BKL49_03530 [Rodentibacter myodis]
MSTSYCKNKNAVKFNRNADQLILLTIEMIVKSSGINFGTGLSMELSQALNKLSSFLDDELVSQVLEESGIATVRKRRLLLESVIWSIIGIGLYRKQSLRSIVSQLDLPLPGKKQVIPPECFVQSKQRLRAESLKRLLN